MPGSAFFFPRRAAGRGHSTITTLAQGSLCPAALLTGEQQGGQGQGRGVGQQPPALCPCTRMCLFGEPVLQRLQDWLGQPCLCSVICRSSKKQNKQKGKEKKKLSTFGKCRVPHFGLWLQTKLEGGGPKDITLFPYRSHLPPYPVQPSTYELSLQAWRLPFTSGHRPSTPKTFSQPLSLQLSLLLKLLQFDGSPHPQPLQSAQCKRLPDMHERARRQAWGSSTNSPTRTSTPTLLILGAGGGLNRDIAQWHLRLRLPRPS